MKIVEPQVFIVGESDLNKIGLNELLTSFGTPEWFTDSENSAEVLVEVAGKICYMSFDTSLNKNLTATGTRNNFTYIQEGLIGTGHGSVLEHVTVSLVFKDVSRIFTHELVRHRVGAAYSQTSGRFVRNSELSFWIPSCIKESIELAELFDEAIKNQEEILQKMFDVSGINRMKGKDAFTKKKELTSAFRRIVGNGVATNIFATYNHRALRNLIEQRTSRHAEEEMRLVFNKVFSILEGRYPAFYDDAEGQVINGLYEITFKSKKV
jgi:thymidylate synthase (FAD)